MVAHNACTQPDIIIFRGWEDPGKYVWSPYVTKLEARLRFAGVKYTTEAGSLKMAPKGKIPYIECHDLSSVPTPVVHEGSTESKVLLSDSALIAKTLTEWNVLPDLNGALDPSKRSHDMGLIALLENKLYFYHSWERWIQNYYTMRDNVLWPIPYPIRVVVGLMVYRKNNAMLHAQGTGRFTAEEINNFRREIWERVSALLAVSRSSSKSSGNEKPFWALGGEQPTEADTCLFGFIVSTLICTAGPDSQKEIRKFPTLLDYAERIHNHYFPDYEKWVV
ncbi:uncharacterized protein F4807DRAFT_96858 [Annulohypoxylon truncatum]|uniref:uncharacterized protein n=1 Tax=Annulohypoxylon truncatum TaxID=327061 RepID=UPI0020075CB9|nr:uncharacterized protein F4807DRAFT_96858 [Annulohypoxylon truncatum]KAI1209548.1 hypothetical protein F4807DRAFT_96858 [Annulohypoxylon truncatum]